MKMKKGFTLIELLIVIAIIGILSAVGLASFRGANQKARDSRRAADVQQIRSALEMYRTDNNAYPGTLAELVDDYLGGRNDAIADSQGVAYTYTPSADNLSYEISYTEEVTGEVEIFENP